MDGIPPSALELGAQQARSAGHPDATAEAGPWQFTLDFPSYFPILTHGKNRWAPPAAVCPKLFCCTGRVGKCTGLPRSYLLHCSAPVLLKAASSLHLCLQPEGPGGARAAGCSHCAVRCMQAAQGRLLPSLPHKGILW